MPHIPVIHHYFRHVIKRNSHSINCKQAVSSATFIVFHSLYNGDFYEHICIYAGTLDSRLAPWFCGAPLTALAKKSGGFRPIAVGSSVLGLIAFCLPLVFSRVTLWAPYCSL